MILDRPSGKRSVGNARPFVARPAIGAGLDLIDAR